MSIPASRRVFSEVLGRGFPFPVGNSTGSWNGTTYVEAGAQSPGLGNLPVSTAEPLKTGSGTLYPIGMKLDTVAKLFYRIKKWDVHAVITADGVDTTVDTVQYAAEYDSPTATGTTEHLLNESELILRGVTATDDTSSLFCGTRIDFDNDDIPNLGGSFFLFAPVQQTILFGHFFYHTSLGEYFAGALTTFDGFYQRNRMLRSSAGLYYPALYCVALGSYKEYPAGSGIQLEDAQSSTLAKGGDPEAVAGGGASIAFDEETCTFTLTGSATVRPSIDEDPGDGGADTPQTLIAASYEVTISPNEYWEYFDQYDPSTGV